jgi:cytochrome c oxidase assembly protein subunit 15
MSMNRSDLWLSRYAKAVAVAGFCLVLLGSLVTTKGAGMAFADWPLSASSLNPAGWWSNLLERLEHGHRLFAEFTGCLIGILCAWVWSSRWAVPGAFCASAILSAGASLAGAPRVWVAHIGLWSSALVFLFILFRGKPSGALPPNRKFARWLSLAAFGGVVIQAILGGLRVTTETAGDAQVAMVFRVVHGCFAQIELCLLVGVAAFTSPTPVPVGIQIRGLAITRFLAWGTFALVLLQLALGATMRHLGIGLAIPTFPAAASDGSWLPSTHNFWVDLNFSHTRLGALAVACFGISLVGWILRTAQRGSGLLGPARVLAVLIGAQIGLGILVVLTYRGVLPTTLHVLNGAAILATSFLLALKTSLLEAKNEYYLAGHEPLPGTAP